MGVVGPPIPIRTDDGWVSASVSIEKEGKKNILGEVSSFLSFSSPAMSAMPAVLETQKAAHGHLAAVYDKIQSAASRCNILACAQVHSPAAFPTPAHFLFVVVVMLSSTGLPPFYRFPPFLLWAKVSLSDCIL